MICFPTMFPYWIIGIGILLNGVLGDAQSESKLQNFLYARCTKYAPNAATYDEIHRHLNDFLSYLRYTANLIPEGKVQFCNEEKPKLENLAKLLAKETEPCFPKSEKFLPNLLKSSFVEFLNFLCYNYGQNIDNFFSTQGKECLQNISQRNGTALITDCFNAKIRSERIVTQEDFCNDLDEARHCFDRTLQRDCNGLTGIHSLNAKFFKSVRKPCNGSTSSTSLTVTVLLTIIASFSTSLLF